MNQFLELTIKGDVTLFNLAHITRIVWNEGECQIIDDEGHRYEPEESYEDIKVAIASLGGRQMI